MKKFLFSAILTVSLVANATSEPVAPAKTWTEALSAYVPNCPVCVSNAKTATVEWVSANPKTAGVIAVLAIAATYKVVSYALSSEDEEDSAN